MTKPLPTQLSQHEAPAPRTGSRTRTWLLALLGFGAADLLVLNLWAVPKLITTTDVRAAQSAEQPPAVPPPAPAQEEPLAVAAPEPQPAAAADQAEADQADERDVAEAARQAALEQAAAKAEQAAVAPRARAKSPAPAKPARAAQPAVAPQLAAADEAPAQPAAAEVAEAQQPEAAAEGSERAQLAADPGAAADRGGETQQPAAADDTGAAQHAAATDRDAPAAAAERSPANPAPPPDAANTAAQEAFAPADPHTPAPFAIKAAQRAVRSALTSAAVGGNGPFDELGDSDQPLAQIFFSLGNFTLGPNGKQLLERKLPELSGDERPILIVGCADPSGSEQVNEKLSDARAQSVAEWLLTHGIDATRIQTRAIGHEGAVGSTLDRRVDIWLGGSR